MRSRVIRAAAIATALASVASCGATRTGTFIPAEHAPPLGPRRPAVDVDFWIGAEPARPHVALGTILLEPDRSAGALNHTGRIELWREIRREAGRLGCDGLILDRRQGGQTIWQQTATCIQYTTVAGGAPR